MVKVIYVLRKTPGYQTFIGFYRCIADTYWMKIIRD